jgi:hypothetical protein
VRRNINSTMEIRLSLGFANHSPFRKKVNSCHWRQLI